MALVIGPAAKLTLGGRESRSRGLEVQLGEQLVCRPGGNGFVHARVLEDRADGTDERVGVEHGPVCPHDGGGQQDQQAGQGDQDADDRSTEPPPPRGLQYFDLMDERVTLCLEAPDLLGRACVSGRLGPRIGMGVAHRYPTLRQVASVWWNAVPDTHGRLRTGPPAAGSGGPTD